MQHFVLIFRFRKMPDKKEESLRIQLAAVDYLSPSQTLGGYIRRIPPKTNQLVLNHPLLKTPLNLIVSNSSENLTYYLTLYNLACSLQNCTIKHSLRKTEESIPFLEVVITPQGSQRDFTVNLFNELATSLKDNN